MATRLIKRKGYLLKLGLSEGEVDKLALRFGEVKMTVGTLEAITTAVEFARRMENDGALAGTMNAENADRIILERAFSAIVANESAQDESAAILDSYGSVLDFIAEWSVGTKRGEMPVGLVMRIGLFAAIVIRRGIAQIKVPDHIAAVELLGDIYSDACGAIALFLDENFCFVQAAEDAAGKDIAELFGRLGAKYVIIAEHIKGGERPEERLSEAKRLSQQLSKKGGTLLDWLVFCPNGYCTLCATALRASPEIKFSFKSEQWFRRTL